MIELISKSRKNVSPKELKEICLLKNEKWKYGINSQLKWFKQNINKKDIFNLLKIRGKIIGLTILRRRSFEIRDKKKKYFLFDTLIISKQFQKKKLSSILMTLNNFVILKNNLLSILICDNDLLKFYKKFGWSKLPSKFFKIKDYNLKSNVLKFNFNYTVKQKKILSFFTKI